MDNDLARTERPLGARVSYTNFGPAVADRVGLFELVIAQEIATAIEAVRAKSAFLIKIKASST